MTHAPWVAAQTEDGKRAITSGLDFSNYFIALADQTDTSLAAAKKLEQITRLRYQAVPEAPAADAATPASDAAPRSMSSDVEADLAPAR